MKVCFEDEKIILYLYNSTIDINNIDEVNKEIRALIIKLIKRYHISFFGYSMVTIYHNSNYGLIIEINKIYSSELNVSTIDLKIVIYKDVDMYLEFDDYCFSSKPRGMIIKNNKYYLNINDIVDIIKYIEYGKVIIKKN